MKKSFTLEERLDTLEELVKFLKRKVDTLVDLVGELDERLTNLEEDQALPFGSYEIEPSDGLFEVVDLSTEDSDDDDDDFGKN